MENRDKNLIVLRPELSLSATESKIGQFQNNTLRPVLKLQNELILAICHHQFIKRKSVFFKLSELKQLDYIEQQIKNDKQFKNLLLGIIIGHFTIDEWCFFKEQEQELRKRMTALLIQRIQSQLNSLERPPGLEM